MADTLHIVGVRELFDSLGVSKEAIGFDGVWILEETLVQGKPNRQSAISLQSNTHHRC